MHWLRSKTTKYARWQIANKQEQTLVADITYGIHWFALFTDKEKTINDVPVCKHWQMQTQQSVQRCLPNDKRQRKYPTINFWNSSCPELKA